MDIPLKYLVTVLKIPPVDKLITMFQLRFAIILLTLFYISYSFADIISYKKYLPELICKFAV